MIDGQKEKLTTGDQFVMSEHPYMYVLFSFIYATFLVDIAHFFSFCKFGTIIIFELSLSWDECKDSEYKLCVAWFNLSFVESCVLILLHFSLLYFIDGQKSDGNKLNWAKIGFLHDMEYTAYLTSYL